jgi:tetratricopeptide (TPR) repeat protein
LRKNQRPEAGKWFEQSRDALAQALKLEPAHADTVKRETLMGRTCRWLGTLAAEDGQRRDALLLFEQAVTYLNPVVDANPTDRNTRYECASAWYELGKRARRDGEGPIAVQALGKVRQLMDPKAVGEALTPEEQFLSSRSQIEYALSLNDAGNLDDAMRSLFDAMEVMVKLVERSKPHNQEQALTLAEAYIEFGEMVAGKLGTTDARDAQAEAQAILIELVRVHPQWADARFLLARNYGALAALERDMGNGAEARRKQDLAVKTLEDLSKDNPDNTRFLSELARQQGMNAQLMCDLGKAKEAIPVAVVAIEKLEALLNKGGTRLDELDRKNSGVLLAQIYGILGHSGEVAKDSKLAKSSFAKASEQWTSLQTKHGTDETIEAGLAWSKERLGKIK